MLIHLLCPGPSLAKYRLTPGPSPLTPDLTIGVNRAAVFAPCDWWVFLDWVIFRDYGALVKQTGPNQWPKIMTLSESLYSLRRRGWANRLILHYVKTTAGLKRFPACTIYSAIWALALAGELIRDGVGSNGVTECQPRYPDTPYSVTSRIEVYGADWTDEPDWDGVITQGFKREKSRWDSERGAWEMECARLKEMGIEVKRILPQSH